MPSDTKNVTTMVSWPKLLAFPKSKQQKTQTTKLQTIDHSKKSIVEIKTAPTTYVFGFVHF